MLMAVMLAGCSATNPGSYSSYDQWTVGDIEVYHLDKGAETRPQIYRMLYGPVLTPPLAAYDAGRIVAAPFVWTYFTARGLQVRGERAAVDAPPTDR
jgi:hypothetical protein